MIEEGAVAYLYKPLDVGELERTIRAIFTGQASSDSADDELLLSHENLSYEDPSSLRVSRNGEPRLGLTV